MPATFIRHREYIDKIEYRMEYRWVDDPNAGYSLECNENGVFVQPDHPSVPHVLEQVAAGKLEETGMAEIDMGYWEPAVIRCNYCRREVVLHDAMTNDCMCGTMYNGSGQELAPREHWGEETGETYADIVSGRDPEALGFPYDMED